LKVADSSVNTEDRGYLYDAAWNLNYRTNNGVVGTFTVDGKNQLTQSPGVTLSYDGNGNITVANYGASGWWQYTYDDENRLTQLYHEASDATPLSQSQFTYDGRSRLRKRAE